MRAGKLSNELSNTDINDLVGQLKIPNFRGCFIRDRVPALKPGESAIVNLNGMSHWVSWYRHTDGTYWYFDSYGIIGPMPFDKFDYTYSEIDIQALSSTACGWYALGFLISMNRGGNPQTMYMQYIDAFKGPEANDVTLKRRFKF